MEARLTVKYDQVGDILYIDKVPPYAAQESEELDQGVVARLNPDTGEIENLEILSFRQRVARGEGLSLPVLASFRASEGA